MVSIMDKATFSQLCKLMDAGDDTVKKFVRGMLKIGLMSAVGLVGAGMMDVLGEGVAWLTDALTAAADDSDAPTAPLAPSWTSSRTKHPTPAWKRPRSPMY